MPLEDAPAMAVMMAVNDRLFSREIFEWKENGDLIADISTAFLGGLCKEKGGGRFLIMNIPRPTHNYDAYERLIGAPQAYTNQGRSDAESLAHNRFSVRSLARNNGNVDFEESNSPNLPLIHNRRTFQLPESYFSGGEFMRPATWVTLLPKDLDEHYRVIISLPGAAIDLRKHWEECEGSDLSKWREYLQSRNKQPSVPIPESRTTLPYPSTSITGYSSATAVHASSGTKRKLNLFKTEADSEPQEQKRRT